MALSTWSSLAGSTPGTLNQLPHAGLWVKGQGSNNWYALEVDSTTGAIPTTASFSADKDWGTVGANTLRTAAIPGNAAGIADFGAGNSSAQTPRVVVATNQAALPVSQSGSWTIANFPTTVDTNFGASSSSTPRAAALVGNATGAADFAAGNSSAQTLRVVVASNQAGIPASNFPTTADTNFGAAGASTIRTAALVGNASGLADYNTGGAGAQTLRSVLATRHEAAATPVSARLGNGASFWDNAALAASQFTQSSTTAGPLGVMSSLGWDGTTHRELAVDTSGNVKTWPQGRAKANTPTRNDYTSTSVTTAAYVQLVASTTLATNRLQIFDSSGQTLKLATGAAASEVDQLIIPPGGIDIDLAIPAGTRVSLKAVSATASLGEIDVNFLT